MSQSQRGELVAAWPCLHCFSAPRHEFGQNPRAWCCGLVLSSPVDGIRTKCLGSKQIVCRTRKNSSLRWPKNCCQPLPGQSRPDLALFLENLRLKTPPSKFISRPQHSFPHSQLHSSTTSLEHTCTSKL